MTSELKPKFALEDCLELNTKHPKTFLVPTKEEIRELKAGDFVYLIFKNSNDEGERMWVEITATPLPNKKFFEGKLANEPILIKEIKEGDKIIFEDKHIANFSTKAEQIRIIEEYKRTGTIPGNVSHASVSDIESMINSYIDLQEENQNRLELIYEINEDDISFFRQSTARFEKELEAEPDARRAFDKLEELYKMYLSLMFMIVTPQIIRNFDEGRFFEGNEYSVYYHKISILLEKSLRIFESISETHLPLLEELRDFHSSEETINVPSEDLAEFFASFIDESLECLSSINKISKSN